jgi:hypothetical protein
MGRFSLRACVCVCFKLVCVHAVAAAMWLWLVGQWADHGVGSACSRGACADEGRR